MLFYSLLSYFIADWEREAVSKAEILRLIYQGRFLHCNVTLGALGLPLGKTTVMHLVPRDNLPEPNSQGTYSPKTRTKCNEKQTKRETLLINLFSFLFLHHFYEIPFILWLALDFFLH